MHWYGCVKDRQITNWKQFTTQFLLCCRPLVVCQRSSNHKLKAIHNYLPSIIFSILGVSKIVKSQIESNSQLTLTEGSSSRGCVKHRQITNWKQFTTGCLSFLWWLWVCQRSSNHKLKAIHNRRSVTPDEQSGVSKIVKSQIESNSQLCSLESFSAAWCVKDRQITNWKQFTTDERFKDGKD